MNAFTMKQPELVLQVKKELFFYHAPDIIEGEPHVPLYLNGIFTVQTVSDKQRERGMRPVVHFPFAGMTRDTLRAVIDSYREEPPNPLVTVRYVEPDGTSVFTRNVLASIEIVDDHPRLPFEVLVAKTPEELSVFRIQENGQAPFVQNRGVIRGGNDETGKIKHAPSPIEGKGWYLTR